MDSQDATDNPGLKLVKQIDNDSVKFLAAGEKINDIETALRELIENSIDAQATNIEVRLSKFGADAIEVDDNGCGIDEKNFPFLGSRYHTSKIIDFKNLQDSLETYGFRGEALSCLCNIAQVIITTKTKTGPTGWKLTFKDGTLSKKERIGRDKGTTVIIKNLFHSMPVRRRELETNAKKQYDKIVRLIYEQVLARPHIKFSLCKKMVARKEKDFTHGGTTLEGCLITMYSIKLLDSLIPIRQTGINGPSHNDLDSSKRDDTQLQMSISVTQQVEGNNDDSSQEGSIKPKSGLTLDSNHSEQSFKDLDQSIVVPSEFSQAIAPNRDEIFFKRSRKSRFAREKPEYTIYGYISHLGKGRNSTDCQYIYVNKKPCDIPRLSRSINDIYRSYNQGNQYPFYCLFIQVQRWATDFNVPRKRGVILQDENKLCDLVKDSLEKMYSSFAPASQKSCPIAQIPFASNSNITANNRVDTQQQACKGDPELPKENSEQPSRGAQTSEVIAFTAVSQTTTATPHPKPPSPKPVHRDRPDESIMINSDPSPNDSRNILVTLCSDVADSIPDLFESAPKRARYGSSTTPTMKTTLNNSITNNADGLPGFQNGLDLFVEEVTASGSTTNGTSTTRETVERLNERRLSSTPTIGSRPKQSSPGNRMGPPPPEPICRYEQLDLKQDNVLSAKIEFAEDLEAALERERIQRYLPVDKKEFSFAIHPKFNAPAEEELKFHLNKTSFTDMQVVGQFNRGFIIGRLNKHLFIIDQHATDERANFEEQLENYPLVKQAMVHPRPLYLSLLQENAILNNMDAFVKRGLEFVVDTSKIVGYRVMLSSTSICRGTDRDEHLGKGDVEELVDVAIESPNRLETYVLSKVNNVSASIACRKSVMIGDKLTWPQMERIVARMSNLKNPWVCAHNRPTIRHLMDVDWMEK